MTNLSNLLASNVVKIPEFTRQTDPVRWIKLFETNLNVVGVTDQHKLSIAPGYFTSTSLTDWFFDHSFTDWNDFKTQLIARFQDTKVSISSVTTSIVNIKRRDGETMNMYIDRFDHLTSLYERLRLIKTDWAEFSPVILKETFIKGIKPTSLKVLVKQNQPGTLREAQMVALRESEDQEEETISELESEDETSKQVKVFQKGKDKNQEMVMQVKTFNKTNKSAEGKSEVERKVDDLSKHLQRLTLMVENQQVSNQRRQITCFNCQEIGHSAQDCTKECKICKGRHGRHCLFVCPEYKPRGKQENYLVMNNNKNNLEAYVVDKCPIESECEKDLRVSRSGKRVKVHDTVPKGVLINRYADQNNLKIVSEENRKVQKSSNSSINEEASKIANEVLDSKAFNVSIKELFKIKGVRSALINKTKRKKRQSRKVTQEKETFQLEVVNKIRYVSDANLDCVGAPRVQVIIDGYMQGNALLDPGSHGSIISLQCICF